MKWRECLYATQNKKKEKKDIKNSGSFSKKKVTIISIRIKHSLSEMMCVARGKWSQQNSMREQQWQESDG